MEYAMAARTFCVIFQRTAGGDESAQVYVDDLAFRKAWEKVRDDQKVYFAEAYMLKLAVPIAVKLTTQSADALPLERKDPPRIAGNGDGGPFR